VWHVKEPSLLKVVSAKHRSKFATLLPVIDSLKIARAAPNKIKQRNKQLKLNIALPCYLDITRIWESSINQQPYINLIDPSLETPELEKLYELTVLSV
jgi:hypothetical protein